MIRRIITKKNNFKIGDIVIDEIAEKFNEKMIFEVVEVTIYDDEFYTDVKANLYIATNEEKTIRRKSNYLRLATKEEIIKKKLEKIFLNK